MNDSVRRVAARWLQQKRAFYSIPVFNKDTVIVKKDKIQAAMKQAGYEVDAFDFNHIEFNDPTPMHGKSGVESIWRVYQKGEVGDLNSEYAYGKLLTFIEATPKFFRVTSFIKMED